MEQVVNKLPDLLRTLSRERLEALVLERTERDEGFALWLDARFAVLVADEASALLRAMTSPANWPTGRENSQNLAPTMPLLLPLQLACKAGTSQAFRPRSQGLGRAGRLGEVAIRSMTI